jgi:hypothetical protein
MFNLLQVELFKGEATCFCVLFGASSREKKYFLKEISEFSIVESDLFTPFINAVSNELFCE